MKRKNVQNIVLYDLTNPKLYAYGYDFAGMTAEEIEALNRKAKDDDEQDVDVLRVRPL